MTSLGASSKSPVKTIVNVSKLEKNPSSSQQKNELAEQVSNLGPYPGSQANNDVVVVLPTLHSARQDSDLKKEEDTSSSPEDSVANVDDIVAENLDSPDVQNSALKKALEVICTRKNAPVVAALLLWVSSGVALSVCARFWSDRTPAMHASLDPLLSDLILKVGPEVSNALSECLKQGLYSSNPRVFFQSLGLPSQVISALVCAAEYFSKVTQAKIPSTFLQQGPYLFSDVVSAEHVNPFALQTPGNYTETSPCTFMSHKEVEHLAMGHLGTIECPRPDVPFNQSMSDHMSMSNNADHYHILHPKPFASDVARPAFELLLTIFILSGFYVIFTAISRQPRFEKNAAVT